MGSDQRESFVRLVGFTDTYQEMVRLYAGQTYVYKFSMSGSSLDECELSRP